MKHIWSILCAYSVTDKETNNLSIFNSLEEIKVRKNDNKKFILPISYELVHFLIDNKDKKVDKRFSLIIELLDPNNKKTEEVRQTLLMSKEFKRIRARTKLTGIPISIEGQYIFRVKLQENQNSKSIIVAELPLLISFRKEI